MEKRHAIELQSKKDELSHEIRTPLNAIIGLSQLICTFPDNEADNLAFAKVIERCADQLLKYLLMNNMDTDISQQNNTIIKIQSSLQELM